MTISSYKYKIGFMQIAMKEKFMSNTKAGSLASELRNDIFSRGMKKGDKYFKAEEIGKLYGVSTVTAHRALTMLCQSGYVVRQRRSGTFIDEVTDDSQDNKSSDYLRVVHILMPISYCDLLEVKDRLFVESIQSMLPKTGVQIHYVPESDPFSYTKRVVTQIKSNVDSEGLVLIRSTEQMQNYVAEERLNSVVFGSVYSGIESISCVDVDQVQTGRLMAKCGLDQGFKQFGLIMFNGWRSGDNILFNAVTETLGKAGIGLEAFQQRSLPTEKMLVEYEIKKMIRDSKEPIMLLCRSDYFADSAIDAINSMGMFFGSDVGVVSGGHFRSSPDRRYPCIVPVMNLREQILRLVRILIDNVSIQNRKADKVIIPVEIDSV